MSTTIDPIVDVHSAGGETAATSSRPRWPIFGVVAGTAAFVASMVGMPGDGLTEEEYGSGIDVLDHLTRGGFRSGFLIGLVSIGALLLAASGWKRWAERRAPDDIAARTIGSALSATAAVNIIGYSLMGSMALYMPGGVDEGWLSRESQFVNFTYLDFGVLFGWWATVLAAGCVAWLSFRPDRLLPRWYGVVSVLLMFPPIALAIGMSLPGMPGFTMPIWLTIVSLGMLFGRAARS